MELLTSTDDDAILDLYLTPLLTACSPVRVKVYFEKKDNEFFIHFDGTESFTDIASWRNFWFSFRGFIDMTLEIKKIVPKSVTEVSDTHVVACMGSLFDFLKV